VFVRLDGVFVLAGTLWQSDRDRYFRSVTSRKEFMKPLTLALLLCWMIGVATAGQVGTATLSGRVTDPAGAVIVKAKVTLTQTAAGGKRASVTNEEGLFVFPNLVPGVYELVIEMEGFKKLVLSAVNVPVGQQVTRDVVLEFLKKTSSGAGLGNVLRAAY